MGVIRETAGSTATRATTATTESPAAARRLSTLVAWTLPWFVVTAAFYTLGSQPTKRQARQLRNAGMLLNGEVLERPAVDVIRESLASGPRLVVLGNSFANTNVYLDGLASGLGIPGEGVKLSIPNSIGAHWYAVLKQHVFGADQEPPDVVLLASDLQSALLTTPQSEGSMGNLVHLAGPPDDVLQRKVDRVNNWRWSVVLDGRRRWRHQAVSWVRDGAASAVHPEVPSQRLRRLTNRTMDQVFHPSKTDPALAARTSGRPVGLDATALPAPEDSFLPDIAELCYRHGARLVLVRNRQSPHVPLDRGDRVPPGTVEQVRALLEPYGGVLMDFRRLPMIEAHFDTIDHMTHEGSRRFTAVLAAALTDLDVPSSVLSRPPAPRREGPVGSELQGVRQSWTRLDQPVRWHFPAGSPPQLRIRAALEGGATLHVDGRALPGEQREGRTAVDTLVSVSGPFTLEARGPGLITALAVGEGAPRQLVGHWTDLTAARLPLLAVPEVFDGEVYLEALRPTFPQPPPPMAHARRRFRIGPRGPFYPLPQLTPISDTATRQSTPRLARCSPLRVFEDGVALPTPNVGCSEVLRLGNGRQCHQERRLAFSASDGSDPGANGRDYRLGWDEDRACDGGFWLYAGDLAVLDVPADRLLEMRSGITGLALDVAFPQRRLTQLSVEIWVDDVLHHPLRIPTSDERLHDTSYERIDPKQSVQLRFRNQGKSVILVNQATLTHR